MQRTFSAPGKLFLSGEYAVLWGGTARVAAVGPRQEATVRSRLDKEVHLIQPSGALIGTTTPLGVHWREPVPSTHTFAAWAIDLALRSLPKETLGFDLELRDAQPRGALEPKWGLGGSARAVVLTAEATRFVLEAEFDTLKLALVAHHEAQGKLGSGGDVAAVFAGGVIRYRRFPAQSMSEAAAKGHWTHALRSAPPVDVWKLPQVALPMVYAFSGSSSSTPDWVRKVDSSLSELDKQNFVDASDALGQSLEEGLSKGDFVKTQVAVEGLHQLLSSLGPLTTPGMERILSVAQDAGCAGKWSGAGGGDGCILFASEDEHREYLLEQLAEKNIPAFPVHVEEGLKRS